MDGAGPHKSNASTPPCVLTLHCAARSAKWLSCQYQFLTARARNHRFWLLSGLRAHEKRHRKSIYCGKRSVRLTTPDGPGPGRISPGGPRPVGMLSSLLLLYPVASEAVPTDSTDCTVGRPGDAGVSGTSSVGVFFFAAGVPNTFFAASAADITAGAGAAGAATGAALNDSISARARKHRFWLLSALRAHTKAP